MATLVHPTAIVDAEAHLAEGVEIGPYAVVEAGVELGECTRVGAHAVVRRGAQVGARCLIDTHAVIAGLPQDLKFDAATVSGVRLGDGVTVREGVTIHRATQAGSFTEVGAGAFLMAYSHLGHDCRLGEHTILANNVMLAGFVSIGPRAFVGGGVAIHQFVRVGEGVMLSGVTRLTRDAPPFTMVAERDHLVGFNLVGLKRRGFPPEEVRALKACYRFVYGGENGNPREAAAAALQAGLGDGRPAQVFLEFFQQSQRGFVVPRRRDDRD